MFMNDCFVFLKILTLKYIAFGMSVDKYKKEKVIQFTAANVRYFLLL